MSAPTVHWQQPNLMAMSETDGHGDTCGPIAILDYVALLGKATLSVSSVDALRQELINKGLMQPGGMTLNQVDQALLDVYGVQSIKNTGYQPNLDMNQYHADIKAAMLAHQLVIEETSIASNYPGAQPGVRFHFVLHGGIDSSEGYFTANGDTMKELSSTQPQQPVWYSWANIASVQPCGYIILPAIPEAKQVITLDKNAGGTVTGAHDDAGRTLGAGFAVEAQNKNLLGDDILVGETDMAGLPAFCVLGNADGPNTVMTWTQGNGVVTTASSDIAHVVQGLLEASQKPSPLPPTTKSDYTLRYGQLNDQLTQLHEEMVANGECK